MTADDEEQSVVKEQQPQPESSSLSSGSVVLNTEDYESIPEDEWIASDMTMYDSPLAELERQHCYIAETVNPLIPVHVSPTVEPESTQSEEPTSSSPVNSSA